MSETKEQWHTMLRGMLDDFRKNHPDDTRSDMQLLTSLMEHFVSEGLITKKDGKYVLPRITPG